MTSLSLFFSSIYIVSYFSLPKEDRRKTEGSLSQLSISFLGGRAYPVRHYPIAIRLRDRKGRAILCIALNPQSGDSSGAILEVPFKALLHGVPSGEEGLRKRIILYPLTYTSRYIKLNTNPYSVSKRSPGAIILAHLLM